MKRHELYVQLISELANYILQGNPKKMVISLHMEPDGFHIAAIDDRPRTDKEIDEIKNSLMLHQRPELASYYGTLLGHDFLGSARLELIGFQVKGVKVEKIPEGGVMINLWIGSEDFDPRVFTINEKTKGA
ncbi:MAG: hypothetical protein ABFC65_05980 [Rectinema sp.]